MKRYQTWLTYEEYDDETDERQEIEVCFITEKDFNEDGYELFQKIQDDIFRNMELE